MKLLLTLLALPMFMTVAHAGKVSEISQYGITWTFDKPYEAGQFVNGDWWVIGPAKVVSVSPEPGPSQDSKKQNQVKSRFGATALQHDTRMRNGSVILPTRNPSAPDKSYNKQGWDSRGKSYNEALTVSYPIALEPGERILSSKSGEHYNEKGKLQTPSMMGEINLFLAHQKTAPRALETVAILTCLDTVPPADAFRPPYYGHTSTFYRAKDIQWDLLPNLPPVPATPDWSMVERAWERTWYDMPNSWTIQYTAPGLNQANYGRELNRLSSITSLMLMLDAPKEDKHKTMIGYLQFGLDLHGLAEEGRNWFSDGGHWQGRKWPILFASIMLDDPAIRDFPIVDPNQKLRVAYVKPSKDRPAPTTVFQEDLDTYYGEGANGQTALWQMVWHTGPISPHQEKSAADYTKKDKKAEAYRLNNSTSYIGIALVAQLMEAKAIWNHDAFFDYVDYWMSDEEHYPLPKFAPKGCEKSFDLFVEEMWNSYRDDVPSQPSGVDNFKFVWNDDKKSGYFINNPKPE